MSSEKRIAASRANSKKSRGPITAEGQRISSRNAARHGLLSQSIVLEGEDKERFKSLLARFVSEHLPQTDSELELVETMAVAKWRQKRIWAVETARISEEIRTRSRNPELASKEPVVRAALAIESIIDRIYIRSKRVLRESRKENMPVPNEAGFSSKTGVPIL
jgi:hypothetical protein